MLDSSEYQTFMSGFQMALLLCGMTCLNSGSVFIFYLNLETQWVSFLKNKPTNAQISHKKNPCVQYSNVKMSTHSHSELRSLQLILKILRSATRIRYKTPKQMKAQANTTREQSNMSYEFGYPRMAKMEEQEKNVFHLPTGRLFTIKILGQYVICIPPGCLFKIVQFHPKSDNHSLIVV